MGQNETERKVPRRCWPPCEACAPGPSISFPCLYGCIGHKLEDIRFVTYPPPAPSKDVVLIDIKGETP